MNIEYYKAKSLVREQKDGKSVHLNPYQGCEHDCVYCDGKAENYNMHADFGSRIRVKENAPQLLEQYLGKRGFLPVNRKRTGTLLDLGIMPGKEPKKFTIGISGGVCDVYQPAEARVGMSRKMLQIVYDYGFSVSLLTKNRLVLKDLDILKKINDNAGATVCMTVVFSRKNERLREIFEPGASTIAERFETLRVLHENGIGTGIWMLPILPWIGDSDDNLRDMVKDAADAGVEFILPGGLTLKPGRSKLQFLGCLERHFPELVPKYQEMYGNNNKYGMPDMAAARRLGVSGCQEALKGHCEKFNVRLDSW
jgi:DNA repair photolyase